MGIKIYKPYTPSTRNKSVLDFSALSKQKPEKSLLVANHRAKGRNNQGKITVRHRGGGHKQKYRIIDFKRNDKDGIVARVAGIEYDPNRSANITHVTAKYKKPKKILSLMLFVNILNFSILS